MTTIKETVCSYDNLSAAMWRCAKNVKWKDSVAGYLMHGAANTYGLKKDILNGEYKISKYSRFKVYEPKERDIVSTKFRDRQFQRSLTDNYLYDAITKSFIYDNHACQIGRGTDSARNRLAIHLGKHNREHGNAGYILKCDLHNYFGSTSHVLAKAAVAKRVHDIWARKCVYDIIDSYDGDRGIGLGSQITQLIELAMLDDLDHIIKEQLHVKHYIRYMDDFMIIHKDKEVLWQCLETINEWLSTYELELNAKKTQIIPASKTVRFLGFNYRIANNGRVLRTLPKDKITHERRKLRKQVALAKQGQMTKAQVNECYQSWRAHAAKGNNHKLVLKIDKYYKDLWRETDAKNQ